MTFMILTQGECVGESDVLVLAAKAASTVFLVMWVAYALKPVWFQGTRTCRVL